MCYYSITGETTSDVLKRVQVKTMISGCYTACLMLLIPQTVTPLQLIPPKVMPQQFTPQKVIPIQPYLSLLEGLQKVMGQKKLSFQKGAQTLQ